MERYRIAVALGMEFPFKLCLTKDMIRQVLTGLLGIKEDQITFKPGTYIVDRKEWGEQWLSLDNDHENFKKEMK